MPDRLLRVPGFVNEVMDHCLESAPCPMRRKAAKELPGFINQPNLVIFDTAIPNHDYDALSERMLTNGLFARMLIFACGRRGRGQEPKIREVPESIIETAR